MNEALVNALREKANRYAHGFSTDPETRAEIAQAALVKALTLIAERGITKAAYLEKVIYLSMVDWSRSKSRVVSSSELSSLMVDPLNYERLIETRLYLHYVTRGLSREAIEALEVIATGERTEDAGRARGISASSMRGRIERARRAALRNAVAA